MKIPRSAIAFLIVLSASVALAADTGPVGPVVPANSEANLPQQIEGFNLSGYSDAGEKTWDIKGDKADITGNQVEVTNVNANSYGNEETNLKAKKGHIDKSTGDVQLQDNVVITTERGAQMKTETLNWERGNNIVTTEDRVTIEDDTMKIQGEGMEAHPGLKAAKLNKDVSADIQANTKDEKKDNRIQITSDGPMEIDQANQTAVFLDNVEAWEEISDRRLKADKMEVKFDEKTKKIKEIVCTGNVAVHQGNNVTHSDTLIYKADEQRMILKGKPKLIIDAGDHTMSDALKGF